MDTLVSKENIKAILDGCMEYINTNIVNISLSAENLAKLEKINKIKLDGTGSKVLSDNGEYIELDADALSTIYDDIQAVYDLFNITISTETWNTKTTDNTARYYANSQIYNDKIYVIGGYNNTAYNINSCYDITTGTWSTKAPLTTSRALFCSAIYNGKIYCFSGLRNGTVIAETECYDIATDSWSSKTSIPSAVYTISGSVVNNAVYIVAYGKAYSYNITIDTWSTITSPPTAKTVTASVPYKNKIYYIGGKLTVCVNTIECYDVIADTWSTEFNPMNTAREGLVSVLYKDNIYCIGGFNTSILNKNECYNITTNTWSTGLNMKTPRSWLAGSIYKNKIYCIGGNAGSGSATVSNINEEYNIPESNYTLTLPDSIQTKLDIIKEDGDGSKVLVDNGTYVNITDSILTTLTDEQVTTLINEINALE